MAAPTTRFRTIPNTTPTTALDTAAERIGTITGETVVSTGAGNEADLGVVNISAGAANSSVIHMLWDVTANGGNALVDTFKLWLSANGFADAASMLMMKPVSGADNAAPTNTENYVANATTSSYTFAQMPETEPASQNAYPTNEAASMDISGGTSVDAVMWATYAAIGATEKTGTFSGTTVGYELQSSFKYTYS